MNQNGPNNSVPILNIFARRGRVRGCAPATRRLCSRRAPPRARRPAAPRREQLRMSCDNRVRLRGVVLAADDVGLPRSGSGEIYGFTVSTGVGMLPRTLS